MRSGPKTVQKLDRQRMGFCIFSYLQSAFSIAYSLLQVIVSSSRNGGRKYHTTGIQKGQHLHQRGISTPA